MYPVIFTIALYILSATNFLHASFEHIQTALDALKPRILNTQEDIINSDNEIYDLELAALWKEKVRPQLTLSLPPALENIVGEYASLHYQKKNDTDSIQTLIDKKTVLLLEQIKQQEANLHDFVLIERQLQKTTYAHLTHMLTIAACSGILFAFLLTFIQA